MPNRTDVLRLLTLGVAWAVCWSVPAAAERPTLRPFEARLYDHKGNPRRLAVVFDLDRTMIPFESPIEAPRGQALPAVRTLDTWLRRNLLHIAPFILTSGSRSEAVTKLDAWGYRAPMYLSTHAGAELWGWDGRLVPSFTQRVDQAWDRGELRTQLAKIVNAHPGLYLFPEGKQAEHHLGIQGYRRHLHGGNRGLVELARELVAEPLQRHGIAVEIDGEHPPRLPVPAPPSELAVRVLPYEHQFEPVAVESRAVVHDTLLSFEIVPWRAGKLSLIEQVHADMFFGDGDNDIAPVLAANLPAAKHHAVVVGNASPLMLQAVTRGWAEHKGPTGIYLAEKPSVEGVLEGLEQLMPPRLKPSTTVGRRRIEWR